MRSHHNQQEVINMTIIRLDEVLLVKERRAEELKNCEARLEKLYKRYKILSEEIVVEEAILRILKGEQK